MMQLLRSHYMEVLEFIVRNFRQSNQEECLAAFKNVLGRLPEVARIIQGAVNNFIPTEPPCE